MLSHTGDELEQIDAVYLHQKTGAKLKLFFQTENALLLSLFFVCLFLVINLFFGSVTNLFLPTIHYFCSVVLSILH
jgi:hypothetical protein